MNSSICCYTCITGSYNELSEHPSIPGIDWIAFSDTVNMDPDWEIRRIQTPVGMTPRRAAKYFKMRPDLVLPEYDQSIWIDGTVRVNSPTFAFEALSWTSGSGIALFRHPERDDILHEADVSLTMPKYQAEPIDTQVEHYLNSGFPRHSGLWCGGIIARQHTALVRQFGEMWLAEVDRWSVQDQLSLPVVLRALNITPGAFPASLYSSPWFTITGHNPNR
jgi:hypothetical protein